MRLRRGVAGITALSLILLGGAGVMSSPAGAADAGTVSISAAGASPSSVGASVGDSLVLNNASRNQDFYISGALTRARDGRDCSTFCVIVAEGSDTYRVDATTVVSIYDGAPPVGAFVGSLTFTSPTPPPDPATIYSTMYLNPNGGDCGTTPLTYTKMNGQNDTVRLPARGVCTRAGYRLSAWVQRATTSQGVDVVYAPDMTVAIGPGSFTLEAVWIPEGVEITYDANVNMRDACTGVNVSASRTVVVVEPLTATLSRTAPCVPAGDLQLTGWKVVSSNHPDAGKVFALGAPVSGLVPAGRTSASVTLAAVWTPTATQTITIIGERTIVSGKPGVKVTGTTTGLSEGTLLVPFVRFPGETIFTEGSARATVDAQGAFSWSRKTGKKVYVYFATQDGKVTSNRVIIQAN